MRLFTLHVVRTRGPFGRKTKGRITATTKVGIETGGKGDEFKV
jgi:hypothetical protein